MIKIIAEMIDIIMTVVFYISPAFLVSKPYIETVFFWPAFIIYSLLFRSLLLSLLKTERSKGVDYGIKSI